MRQQKKILIIGGGISGITAAVELAETGQEVILAEKLPYLGGRVIRMNSYFPKLCPPACGMEINFRRIKQNRNITVMTSTEVSEISGPPGNIDVKLTTGKEYVNQNCTACGECEKVCPDTRPDDFNYDMGETKVIYMPHEMAYPFRYVIDGNHCKKESCNKCVQVCKYQAVNLDASEKQTEINVAGVIIATGWKPYDANKIPYYIYSDSQDIVRNVEFERILARASGGDGKIKRLSDGKIPDVITFIQCAGSRDENHLPYCSAVCCSASLKHALTVRELNPDTKVKIFYIDIRVSGRNEDILKKVEEDKNIELIKGKAGLIEKDASSGKLIIEAEDILYGRKIKEYCDLVVLATGIVPSSADQNIMETTDTGFIDSERLPGGIFAVSCTRQPLDVSASLKDATGIALKALQTTL